MINKTQSLFSLLYFSSAKNYVVNVVTGDVKNAGTDANVFLTIFGQNGDTGERQLSKSETHSNKFERNQVICSSLLAVTVWQ
jgi:lipoxygenase homology domain-containing protein 1